MTAGTQAHLLVDLGATRQVVEPSWYFSGISTQIYETYAAPPLGPAAWTLAATTHVKACNTRVIFRDARGELWTLGLFGSVSIVGNLMIVRAE